MKLRSAVARAMMLLAMERKRAKIVREDDLEIMEIEEIESLAAE
jgi:hypothetical protein